MKVNRIHRPRRGLIKAIFLALLLAAVATALILAFTHLRARYLALCTITDAEKQVSIEAGKMVKKDVLAHCLGLTNGANLATIDFEEKREETLRKIPNLREIVIRRHLPDRVSVTIEERTPIARLALKGKKKSANTGRVADEEGVVFEFMRGTELLPVILEKTAPLTARGQRLTGRARAAIHLVAACHDPALQEIGLLDIDLSRRDYLLATISTGTRYAQLKIAWEGMDEEETPASRASLVRQLTHVRDAIRARVADDAVIWNATDFSTPGRIYADTKGSLR